MLSFQTLWMLAHRHSLQSHNLSSEVKPLPFERAGPERKQAAGLRGEVAVRWTGESALQTRVTFVSLLTLFLLMEIFNVKMKSIHCESNNLLPTCEIQMLTVLSLKFFIKIMWHVIKTWNLNNNEYLNSFLCKIWNNVFVALINNNISN